MGPWAGRNVRDYAAGFDYTKISIDIYILADALNLITFEWIADLAVAQLVLEAGHAHLPERAAVEVDLEEVAHCPAGPALNFITNFVVRG
jgi:hypothetical protein